MDDDTTLGLILLPYFVAIYREWSSFGNSELEERPMGLELVKWYAMKR